MVTKLRDLTKQETCTHPEHGIDHSKTYEPGIYVNVCPDCGLRTEFQVLPGSYLAGVR